jgi:VanZ family protein
MATVAEEMDYRGLRWALWLVCVVVWTLMLVRPEPAQVLGEVVPKQATYPVAKTGHISAYAFLTVLSAWLRVRGGKRWLLLAFLSLHGVATELIQTQVPGRHGSPLDVGFDHIGILIGLALSWKWWRG